MEEEIVIIVRKNQARVVKNEAVAEAETFERVFRGPDRFKKAAKFIRAIKDVQED